MPSSTSRSLLDQVCYSRLMKNSEITTANTLVDNSDAQSWYLLGRCYMSQQKYPKAYEAYQQAVYRDGKNPTFWCSIGVLYYQINQYRDALDAYSRAIRLNPYISEVWYDLGTLYESCNNQIADALDAYQRAAELDPGNPHIKTRLQLLRSGQSNGGPPPAAPQPADVHPHAYHPSGPSGPTGPQWGGLSGQQQPPGGGPPPPAPGAGESWAKGLSNVNPPPQPPNPYGERSVPAPPVQRAPSPGQDHMRGGYPDSQRGSGRGGRSPAPANHQYGQPPAAPGQAPPTDRRVPNPNWSGAAPSAGAPPGGPNGSSQPPPNGSSFRPNSSPRHERGPHENRLPSPKSGYSQAPPPHPQYSHREASASVAPNAENHREPAPSNNGPPASENATGPRAEDRPPSTGPKRPRDWEDESAAKKQANDDTKARLSDFTHRRASTPPAQSGRRPSGEAKRADEPRRAEEPPRKVEEPAPKAEPYHPSEAAHHPRPNGPNQVSPDEQPAAASAAPAAAEKPAEPAVAEKPKEEAPAAEAPATRSAPPAAEPERAARKMDVDEDYDDAEDDKKTLTATNGSAPASTAGDTKTVVSDSGSATNSGTVTATKSE